MVKRCPVSACHAAPRDHLPVAPLPLLTPMAATNGPVPPDDGRWLWEVKWDGWRAVVYVDGGQVRVMTRRGRNVTASFPELHGLADALGGRQVVLDGELVAARAGELDFYALSGRHGAARATAAPAAFAAFDLLWLDGQQITHLPLIERKHALRSLNLSGPAWREIAWQIGDGDTLFAGCTELGLEGVVAKRLDSRYRPGARTTLWRKRKCRAWLEEHAPRRVPLR